MLSELPFEDVTLIWEDVVSIASKNGDEEFNTWLSRLSPVSLKNNVMTVSAPNRWTVKTVSQRLAPDIEALLYEVALEPITLEVALDETPAGRPAQPLTVTHVTQKVRVAPPQVQEKAHMTMVPIPEPARAVAPTPVFDTRDAAQLSEYGHTPGSPTAPTPLQVVDELDNTLPTTPILQNGVVPVSAVSSKMTDFSFDTYIVGESNTIAYNMARTVAEQPGSVPNPLFIWGPSGNGKTHLLLSIMNYIYAHQPSIIVRYVSANTFVEQYIDDIRVKKRQGKEVLREYRDIDVLLVDDVQFFENKQETVITFFDIFNQLILDGKQIVLAADTAPDYLKLDDRMRTRFGQGLVVDIKAPTYEMKRSILKSFYERCRVRMSWCNVEIPNSLFDVLAQLAPNNPRSMEGLVRSIMIKADTNPRLLSPEGIKEIVGEMFKSSTSVNVTSIMKVVCDKYGVSVDDVKSKSRMRNISEARQVIMWLARQLTDESYESIGSVLGGRDHSTIYYGINTVEKRLTEDKGYSYELDRLKNAIIGSDVI